MADQQLWRVDFSEDDDFVWYPALDSEDLKDRLFLDFPDIEGHAQRIQEALAVTFRPDATRPAERETAFQWDLYKGADDYQWTPSTGSFELKLALHYHFPTIPKHRQRMQQAYRERFGSPQPLSETSVSPVFSPLRPSIEVSPSPVSTPTESTAPLAGSSHKGQRLRPMTDVERERKRKNRGEACLAHKRNKTPVSTPFPRGRDNLTTYSYSGLILTSRSSASPESAPTMARHGGSAQPHKQPARPQSARASSIKGSAIRRLGLSIPRFVTR